MRCYQTLIVRRHSQFRTEYLYRVTFSLVPSPLMLSAMDDLSDAIPLRQILVGVVHIFDRPEEGLGNCVIVLNSGVEFKQVSDGRLALCQICASGDMDR